MTAETLQVNVSAVIRQCLIVVSINGRTALSGVVTWLVQIRLLIDRC